MHYIRHIEVPKPILNSLKSLNSLKVFFISVSLRLYHCRQKEYLCIPYTDRILQLLLVRCIIYAYKYTCTQMRPISLLFETFILVGRWDFQSKLHHGIFSQFL